MTADIKPSDERNGNFLDSHWCCKVCDGEIPNGHTEDCDIWKLEKKYNALHKQATEILERVKHMFPGNNGKIMKAVRAFLGESQSETASEVKA